MKRIAIIDDEKDYCTALANSLLRSGDCVAECCTTPAEAGAFLEEFAPDVVILDERMPGMSGRDVHLALHRHDSLAGVCWILLSGTDAVEETAPGAPPLHAVPKYSGVSRIWEIINGTTGRTTPRHRILVVDDELDFCHVIRNGLEATGRYEITTLTDPFMVEETLSGANMDAVLLDLRMPGRSGEEVILSLKSDPRWHQIPVILMTALWHKDGKLSRYTDVSVLSKPVSFEQLDKELGKLLAAVV